jgi:hypothetical protein
LDRLWALDEKLDLHSKSILHYLDSLSSPNLSIQTQVELDLVEEKLWLQTSLKELRGFESHPDPDVLVVGEVMHDRISSFMSAVDLYLEILQDRSTPLPPNQKFSMGMFY